MAKKSSLYPEYYQTLIYPSDMRLVWLDTKEWRPETENSPAYFFGLPLSWRLGESTPRPYTPYHFNLEGKKLDLYYLGRRLWRKELVIHLTKHWDIEWMMNSEKEKHYESLKIVWRDIQKKTLEFFQLKRGSLGTFSLRVPFPDQAAGNINLYKNYP